MESLPPITTTGAFTPSDGGSASVAGDGLATPASMGPSPITPSSPGAEQFSASAAPFRVAIIGGGIGGLTAALFIDQFCNTPGHRRVEISIYEQANEYKEIGAGIGLGPNATKLLARLGSELDGTPILDAVNAISGTRNGVWFIFRRFDTGEEIVTVPRNEPEDSKIRFVAVNRAELHSILLQHVQQKPEIVSGRLFTGKKLVSIREGNDHGSALSSSLHSPFVKNPSDGKPVKMTFQDGTTAFADLVIAADGIRSAARRQFIADEPVYGNKILYRGLIPMSALPTPWPMSSHVVMWNAIGAHFVMYPISADRTINIIACKDKALSELGDDLAHESWVATCDRSELEGDFADFQDPLVGEIIRLMPQRVSKWRINDRRPINKWVFMGGRVVLLGDAAHPMVPHQSAGAGQAVEDGYILAKALGEFLHQKEDDSNIASKVPEPVQHEAEVAMNDQPPVDARMIFHEAGLEPHLPEDMNGILHIENSHELCLSTPPKPALRPVEFSSSPSQIQLDADTEPGCETTRSSHHQEDPSDHLSDIDIFDSGEMIWESDSKLKDGDNGFELAPTSTAISGLENHQDSLPTMVSLEDGTIANISDHTIKAKGETNNLEKWMTLYQNVRMPRAARTQASSRRAGDLFEMMGPEMQGKSYEERLPILREQAKENMKWIWTEDIDAAWDKGLAQMDQVSPF